MFFPTGMKKFPNGVIADVTKFDMAAVSVLASDEYAICESLLEISSKISNLDSFLVEVSKIFIFIKNKFLIEN